jgi:hypothetical protein
METFDLYKKDKRLTMNLVMDNNMKLWDISRDLLYSPNNTDLLDALRKDADEELNNRIDIGLATIKIRNKIKEFEAEIWFKGLQERVLATRDRGVSAHTKKNNNFCVLTYTMCGRTMITIEDDRNSVTCVADETSKESRTGFHGINATGEDAIALIDLAINLYKNNKLSFEIDKKVSMGF